MGDSQGAVAPRLNALTSLRFFAATFVVIHHTIGPGGTPLVDLGFLGVTFFFVLLGAKEEVPHWTSEKRSFKPERIQSYQTGFRCLVSPSHNAFLCALRQWQ